MKKIACALLAAALAVLSGCSSTPQTASSGSEASAPVSESSSSAAGSTASESTAPAVELTVSAAASLTDCMNELSALYKTEHPEITLVFNFGSSGALQQQIEQGAPVDVFVSAGKKQMSALQERSLMEDSTVLDILENKVVLVTPVDGDKLESFDALTGDMVKQIGVGEPESVPVGQYTQEIFESMGLTGALASKLVYAKDVREVLSWVETGNVQAGIVYETDAKISDKVTICCTAPTDSHKPVVYPMGVVKDSNHPQEAREFTEFLLSDAAMEVFTKYGFTPCFNGFPVCTRE